MRPIPTRKPLLATRFSRVSLLLTRMQREMQNIKSLPHRLIQAIQQPSTQYRLAFLLGALLALLLAWPLFVSTLPHCIPLAFL